MKKGFTLIEMIGVMVILSLLLAFVMPNVINYIKKGGDTKDHLTKEMIYKATQNYLDDNNKIYKKNQKNTYCISLNVLANDGYIESPITLSSSDEDITNETSKVRVKVTYDKKYKYELTNKCSEIIDPVPVLTKGLIPVEYKNNKWVVADKNTNTWYDYDKQKWANAVTLLPGVEKEIGDEVKVDGTEASMMFVWIPRYEYKIEGTYGKHSDNTDGTQENPGEIEINFISKNTTEATEDYILHPAFTFGDKEESGFWVGKFELSHETLSSSSSKNNLGCTGSGTNVTCTADATKFRILPNVQSLRYNSVSNFWYGIKSIENTSSFGLTNIDIHMMKNSEWGAVAYLSQSKYGKYGNKDYTGAQKEIYQNKSSSYITGSSNGTPSQDTSYTQCTYNQKKGTDTNQDQNNCGPGASTTGNIYGVYDMSGGADEYVMGAYGTNADGIYSGYSSTGNSSTLNSGFNGKTGYDGGEITNGVALPEAKYYDKYTTNDALTACNNGICYGHSISETSGWYNDHANMVYKNYPWFVRGGFCIGSTFVGVFGHDFHSGNSNYLNSARVVGFGK